MEKLRSIFSNKSTETCEYKKKGNWAAGYHTGVDRICNTKTIYAPADCSVLRCEFDKSYGNFVVLKISDYVILLAHLKSLPKLKKGDKLKQGNRIGTMGSSGNSSGEHTHIEVEKGASWKYNTNLVNPNDLFDWNYTKNKNSTIVKYDKGSNYILTANLNVRSGAGTQYRIKKVKELTADGKKHATSNLSFSNAALEKGTVVTALDVIKKSNGDIWLKIPSGYIAVYHEKNKYANWKK